MATIKDRLRRLEKNKLSEILITGFRVICDDDAEHHNQMIKAGYVLVRESNGFCVWVENDDQK